MACSDGSPTGSCLNRVNAKCLITLSWYVWVRLSAGRHAMSDELQALCFLAGANSIFTGDKLLTAPNAGDDTDAALFAKLGLTALQQEEPMRACKVAEPAE